MIITPKLPALPMRNVAVSMSDEMLDELDAIGAVTNSPRAALIREAVDLWLSLHDQPLEMIAGILDGLEHLNEVAGKVAKPADTQ